MKNSYCFNHIEFSLIKTNRRLTLDIHAQDKRYRNVIIDARGMKFIANNGYEIISRSRMDIQTERLWLLGSQKNERSGSMVFSTNIKRDEAYDNFMQALIEWDRTVVILPEWNQNEK